MKMQRFSFSCLFASVFGALIGFFTLQLTQAFPLDATSDNDQSSDVGEYGNYVEGDMILTDEQKSALFGQARNGLIATKFRWPNKTIPYELSCNHTKEQRDYIEKGLDTLQSVSCLKFVRRTNEVDYVELRAGNDGCYSEVGRVGGKQVLNLQNYPLEQGCFRLATIMHEFLHALGFYHMQSAYDRGQYVTIRYENILEGTKNNFDKYTKSEITYFNTTYDYYSVMHYNAYGFSKNGQPTIVPTVEKYLKVIGQRQRLSVKDIIKLNAMYECEDEVEEQKQPEEV